MQVPETGPRWQLGRRATMPSSHALYHKEYTAPRGGGPPPFHLRELNSCVVRCRKRRTPGISDCLARRPP
eukprot:211058-Lingulodinium_polyedra.AAC.1